MQRTDVFLGGKRSKKGAEQVGGGLWCQTACSILSGDSYQHYPGLTLYAYFLEIFLLLYLKLACALLRDALAAVLLISLCSLMDVRLLPPKPAQSVSQLWLAVVETVRDLVKASPKPAVELESGHCPAIQGMRGPEPQAKLFKSWWSPKRQIKDHRNYLKLSLKYSIVDRL